MDRRRFVHAGLAAGALPLVPATAAPADARRHYELRTYETVVIAVPADGKASVVAVDQTLYSAKGA